MKPNGDYQKMKCTNEYIAPDANTNAPVTLQEVCPVVRSFTQQWNHLPDISYEIGISKSYNVHGHLLDTVYHHK